MCLMSTITQGRFANETFVYYGNRSEKSSFKVITLTQKEQRHNKSKSLAMQKEKKKVGMLG